jgi:hypothetical protein
MKSEWNNILITICTMHGLIGTIVAAPLPSSYKHRTFFYSMEIISVGRGTSQLISPITRMSRRCGDRGISYIGLVSIDKAHENIIKPAFVSSSKLLFRAENPRSQKQK